MDNQPALHLYKLSFTAPLHIGSERDDYAQGSAMVHSDTLYAAIFWAWDKLGKAEWIPTHQQPEPAFTLSSLFPFYKDSFFLPRPLYSPATEYQQLDDTAIRKNIKKSAWVDPDIFQLLLSDQPVPYQDKSNFLDGFWSSNSLPKTSFITSQVMPRVSVPREGGEDTTIFYIERFFFTQDAGLYCLVQFNDATAQQQFEAALRFLGDEGFGTDRNIGHGKFTFTHQAAFSLQSAQTHGLAISLGLYCPPDKATITQQLQHKAIGYDLLKRGGWLSEPYQSWRKKSVYFFKEGTVLQIPQQASVMAIGKNVDVNPQSVPVPHPVWRNGKTLFLSF